MIATPQDVQRALALSDEEIAELRKEQDKMLKKFNSRANLTHEERMLAYAIQMERHHRKTGKKDALAEAIAAQGRYAEAAEIAVRPALKQVLCEKAQFFKT